MSSDPPSTMPKGFFHYLGEHADDPTAHLEDAKKADKIWIDARVKEIPECAFAFCWKLKEVKFLDPANGRLETIGYKAFADSPIESIEIPSSVTTIGEGAFSRCKELKEVKFLDPATSRLETIGNYAFADSPIESIEIPSSVKTIGEGAFCSCKELKEVKFLDPANSRLETIGSCAFAVSPIESIEIPSSVTTIGKGAFRSCPNLDAIHFDPIKTELKEIQEDAFCDCFRLNLSSFQPSLPFSLSQIDQNAFRGCTFQAPFLVTTREAISSIPSATTHVMVQSNVDSIMLDDFKNCERLQRIDFHPCLECIDLEQRYYELPLLTNLRYLKVPDSVENFNVANRMSLETVVFGRESKLKKSLAVIDDLNILVEFPDRFSSEKRLSRIHKLAYFGCPLEDIKKELESNPKALQGPPESAGDKKWTVLEIYLKCGHADPDVIQVMVSNYPEAITRKDESGRYPIHHFCQNQTFRSFEDDRKIARMLVQKSKGAVLVADEDGMTPFEHAIGNLSWSALEYLYSVEPVTPIGEQRENIRRLQKDYIEKFLSVESQPKSLDTFSMDEQNGWVKFVTSHVSKNLQTRIVDMIKNEEICSQEAVKALALARNTDNRTAMEVAVPKIRTALEERLLFLKRYEVTSAHVLHKSATCIVVEARDAKMNDYYKQLFERYCEKERMDQEKFGNFLKHHRFLRSHKDDDAKKEIERLFRTIDVDGSNFISEDEFADFCNDNLGDKVVLKLMRNENQFINEITSRKDLQESTGTTCSEYVIDILRCHAPSDMGCNVDASKLSIAKEMITTPHVEAIHLKEHTEKFYFSQSETTTEILEHENKEDDGIFTSQGTKQSETHPNNTAAKEAEQYKYVIVMTKGDRNLDTIFRSERPKINTIRVLMKQIAQALIRFHEKGLIHGDLKMLNVVRESHTNLLKLIDLDAASKISKPGDQKFVTSKFSSGVLPPEAVYFVRKDNFGDDEIEAIEKIQDVKKSFAEFEDKEKKAALWDTRGENAFVIKNAFESEKIRACLGTHRLWASEKLDVWAFGVLLYCFCTGETLFEVNRDDDIGSFDAMSELYRWDALKCDQKLVKVHDSDAKELLRWILQKDPERRPSMVQIEDSIFFNPSKKKDMTEIHVHLSRIEKKIDVVIEKIDNINKNLMKANNQLSEILGGGVTPRLIYVVPAERNQKQWWKSIKATKKVKICFVCPITYEIPSKNGEFMGYDTVIPEDWVIEWGPRIVMTLKVCQFALSVGRMAGLPLPSLDGVQNKVALFATNVSENLASTNELMSNLMNHDNLKELSGGNDFFSDCLDLVSGEKSAADYVAEKLSGVSENIENMELPQEKQKLINESSNKIREIAGPDDVQKHFEKSGLKLAECGGKREFVHEKALKLFEKYGDECFKMTQKEITEKIAELKTESKVKEAESKVKEAAKMKEAGSKMKEDYEKRLAELEQQNVAAAALASCGPCIIM